MLSNMSLHFVPYCHGHNRLLDETSDSLQPAPPFVSARAGRSDRYVTSPPPGTVAGTAVGGDEIVSPSAGQAQGSRRDG